MQPTLLLQVVVFSLLGSVGSLVGGIILVANERMARRITHRLAAFAAGALLGTAFLDLLPEAIEAAKEPHPVFLAALGGMIFFFVIERFVHWFHPHHEDFDVDAHESKITVPLLVIGDTIHNFIDGVVIGATFLASVPLGITTTIAVAAHEIPQEIGDFAIMLHRGVPRRRVILYNILSALAALLGAVLVLAAGDALAAYLPTFLAVTAGFFIYIAASDLLPELHHEHRRSAVIVDTLMLFVGMGVVWASVLLLHGE